MTQIREIHSSPTWQEALTAYWRAMPFKAVAAVLVGAWLALFHFWGNSTLGYVNTPSLFGWYYWVLTTVGGRPGNTDFWGSFQGEEAYIWFVPLVVGWLFWSRREAFMAVPKRIWWPALGLFVIAVGLHLLGFMVQQTRLSVVGFFLGLFALGGWLWGPLWMREGLFPFCLFAFCIPMGQQAEFVTFPLRMLVTKLSVAFSHYFLGIEVVRDGSRIFNRAGTFQYDVAPACSGIRSLVALTALTTIYGYLTFQRTWKRCLVAALAVPLAVIGNTTRLVLVILIGEVFGQQAGATWEQWLGLPTFLIALVVLLVVGQWLRDEPPQTRRDQTPLRAGPLAPVDSPRQPA